MTRKKFKDKLIIGWNEWCKMPTLGLYAIKAKIDTGARTSALHAFDIKKYMRSGKAFVSFNVHPLQKNSNLTVHCRAPIVDEREIMSSNGHKELRYVIETMLHIGDMSWQIEMTLSNRDPLRYRMLLGRNALAGNVIIEPSLKLIQGKFKHSKLLYMYKK